MVSVQLHLDGFDEIQRKLSMAASRSEYILAVQVRKDTEPFVPASDAPAGMHIRTQVHGNTIIYPGPYARYLYYGKLMVDPETGSAWARKGATKVLADKNLVFRKDVHSKAQSHWFEASKAQNLDKWIRIAAKEVTRGKGK